MDNTAHKFFYHDGFRERVTRSVNKLHTPTHVQLETKSARFECCKRRSRVNLTYLMNNIVWHIYIIHNI